MPPRSQTPSRLSRVRRARLHDVSRPSSPALPGGLLSEPWVVEVRDSQGSVVNNRPLSARFEALDGGSVVPIQTAIEVTEGSVVPVEQARFSAQVAPGPTVGQTYHFRVTVSPAGPPPVSADLAIETDAGATNPSAPRLLVRGISLALPATDLAVDVLAAKLLPAPVSVPYTVRVRGVEVARVMHEHYETRTNSNSDGSPEIVQVLVARHPCDQVSAEQDLAGREPGAQYSVPGVVKLSGGTMAATASGESRVWMTMPGVVGFEPAHPDCQTTFVKMGAVNSPTNRVRVYQISDVNFSCDAIGDHFQNRLPFEVRSAVTLTAGDERANKHGRDHVRLRFESRGTLQVSQSPPVALAGLVRGELTGLGSAELSAYLEDPSGGTRFETALGEITLNTVTVLGPWGVLAGEQGRAEVKLQGGAPMDRYRVEWQVHPASNGAAGRSWFAHPESRFESEGDMGWVAGNVFFYSERAVEPLTYSPGPNDAWSATILARDTGAAVALGPNTKYAVNALPPRLNHLRLLAYRPGQADPTPTANGLDLFADNATRHDLVTRMLATGVFARSVQKPLSTTVRWSLGESPLLSVSDLAKYLFQQGGGLTDVGNEITADGRYYLQLLTFLKPGEAILAAAVDGEAHRKLYGIHNLLKGDAAILPADWSLSLRANVLRLENVIEEGVVRLRLRSEGPTALDLHTARWSMQMADGSTVADQTSFARYPAGGWQTSVDEPAGARQAVAEVLDAPGTVVGRAALTLKPTKLAVITPSVVLTGDSMFDVAIEVRNIPKLTMYSGRLNYDPARLDAVSVSEGSFLRGANGRTFFEGAINATTGQITFSGSRANGESASGNGALVLLTFRPRGTGDAPLTLGTTFLYDSPTTVVAFQALDSSVTVRESAGALAQLEWTDLAPMVDGAVDARWAAAPAHPLARLIRGASGGSDDVSASWKATWDGRDLYLLVQVRDDQLKVDSPASVPWDDDSVELFVDGNDSKSGVYEGRDDFHLSWTALGLGGPPRFGFNSRQPAEGTSFVTAGQASATGYVWEAAIPWQVLGIRPSPGLRLGLDVQVNDDDDGGAADAALAWAQDCFCAWESPSRFGSAILARQLGEVTEWRAALAELVAREGLPPSAADPFADPDGDGWSNLAEYAVGATADEALSPANAPGLFRAEAFATGEVAIILPFAERPDVEYVLETSPTMAGGSWTGVARKPKGGTWSAVETAVGITVSSSLTGGTRVTASTQSATEAFFRVRFSP